jgi:hypothetical protein
VLNSNFIFGCRKISYFFTALLCLALFLGGCIRQDKRYKKNSAKREDSLNVSMLEGIAIPFESVIEQDNSEQCSLTANTGDDVFYINFSECSVDFLTVYYKNTMEQSGWILQKEFNSHDFLILNFFSVSRICLICIYKAPRRLLFTKKIMICVGEKNS